MRVLCDDDMVKAYLELHNQGYAHSVEVWQDGKLVGGLYGVALGKAFFGESMFSRVSNASKVGLVTLCHHLSGAGFEVIDCQVASVDINQPNLKFSKSFKQALVENVITTS